MKLFDYNDVLARIKACKSSRFGFGEALAVTDQVSLENQAESLKLQAHGSRNYHGVDIVKTPFMGTFREVEMTSDQKSISTIADDPRNQRIWLEISQILDEGGFRLERIIPDMTGKTGLYSLSLVQISNL